MTNQTLQASREWWSQRWLDLLDSYRFKKRLERARNYARQGNVLSIEFKEAKADFSFDKLAKYCAALSNEGGGRLILGVTDKKPRLIVGTQAFADLNRTTWSAVDEVRVLE